VTIAVDDARRLLLVGGPEFDERWFEVIELCSHDPAARAALADLQERAAELEDEHDGAGWIAQMLRVLHEAPFVAFHFDERVGIAGRMSGIADNFQLHTLLMDVFPAPRSGLLRRPRRRVSEAVAANARGDGPQALEEPITGAWNLYTHAAVVGGRLPDPSDQAMWPTWIWNEGVPADIPELDGHRVIILGPAPYSRGWQAQRVFPRLPATLDARELSRAEVDDWAARVGA
jgi:hypothetical protein